MKIENTVRQTVQSSDQGQKTKIGVSSDITKIVSLLTNIYKDPIAAVIRELFANAVDATKAANSTQPVSVQFPSLITSQLVIRDYGIGMSDDFVHKTYSVYGATTKDSTNDLIGGFGIGGKSPYAYTDSFSLTTWDGSHMRMYQMTKSTMEVVSLGTVPSSEPRGVQVTVPIRTDDVQRFRSVGADILRWFPKTIYTTNIAVPSGYDDLVIENGVASNTYRFYGSPKLLLGNILYEWDNSNTNFKKYLDEKALEGLVDFQSIIPVFGIGDITLSPNRETVIMDPKTVAALGTRVGAYVQHKVNKIADIAASFDPEKSGPDIRTLSDAERRYLCKMHNVTLTRKTEQHVRSLPLYKCCRKLEYLPELDGTIFTTAQDKVERKLAALQPQDRLNLVYRKGGKTCRMFKPRWGFINQVQLNSSFKATLSKPSPDMRGFAPFLHDLANCDLVDISGSRPGILETIRKNRNKDYTVFVVFNGKSEPEVGAFLADFLEIPKTDIIKAKDYATEDDAVSTSRLNETATLYTPEHPVKKSVVTVRDLMMKARNIADKSKVYIVPSIQGTHMNAYAAEDLARYLAQTYQVVAASLPKSYIPSKKRRPSNVVVLDEEYRTAAMRRLLDGRWAASTTSTAFLSACSEFDSYAARIYRRLITADEERLIYYLSRGIPTGELETVVRPQTTQLIKVITQRLVEKYVSYSSREPDELVSDVHNYQNGRQHNSNFTNRYLKQYRPDLFIERIRARRAGRKPVDIQPKQIVL